MSEGKSLKPGWNVLRFDQIAKNITERAEPTPDDSALYVGLEHMDTGSLRVRRWGSQTDLIGTKFKMRKGDILFARRNAYLKRIAIAPHDGLFSAHGMVLRAKPDVVLPEFLPFFMQSDIFMNRAVEISVGSLSPTINWKTMAVQEFALPSLDIQSRIVSAIKSALKCELAYEQARNSASVLFRSASIELLDPAESWKKTQLQDVATVERGKFSHRPRNLPEFFGGPYPFVQTGDIVASTGDLRGASQMLSDEGLKYSKSFPKGSILITIAANIGFTAITTQETWCPDSVVGVVPRDGTDVRFLEYALRSKQKHLENHVATQTAQKNINLQDLRPLCLDMPESAIQKEIADQLHTLEGAIANLDSRYTAARDFRVRLANEMIGVADV